MTLDEIKAIRDYWRAGHTVGEVEQRFPHIHRRHLSALTTESEDINGHPLPVTLGDFQRVLPLIPLDGPRSSLCKELVKLWGAYLNR